MSSMRRWCHFLCCWS